LQRGVNPLNLYFLAEWALTAVEDNLTYSFKALMPG